MLVIKINEEQPLPCPKCKEKFGYQYSDTFRMHYTSFHDAEGKYEGGEYSDGNCLNRAVTVYCTNCCTKLPFKLKRERFETVNNKNY